MKTIDDLELHETLSIDRLTNVIRVPNGLIYTFYSSTEHNSNISSTFVAYEPKNNQKPKELFKWSMKSALKELGVEESIISDWLKIRSKKKATNTETAFKAIKNQIMLSGKSANECIKICVEMDWKGFKADWLSNKQNNQPVNTNEVDNQLKNRLSK